MKNKKEDSQEVFCKTRDAAEQLFHLTGELIRLDPQPGGRRFLLKVINILGELDQRRYGRESWKSVQMRRRERANYMKNKQQRQHIESCN